MQLALGHQTTGRFCGGNKLLVLFLFATLQIYSIAAQRSCYQCQGINCLRSTYKSVETCSNGVDICATVYDGSTIQAQGCLGNLAKHLRTKCDSDDADDLPECHKCNENLCNKWAADVFECVQCDSSSDSKCSNNVDALQPTRCPISRTANMYCFATKDGNRVVRGCTSTLEEQRACLASEKCEMCDPSELGSCNGVRADGGSGGGGGNNNSTSVPPTEKPQPSAGPTIEFSIASCWVILVAYLCKLL
uniref:DUF753 domain-containing protein n=1 Tax=Musca domestica TaxID=7370 RepID=A0A1I8NG85_MUSDO